MKIAVCYSGLYRAFSGWQENHKVITDYADSVYYSTWHGKAPPPVGNVIRFPEPVVKYDPFFCTKEIAESRKPNQGNRRKDLLKQILAHQYMVTELNGAYDIVIRMRYDVWFGDFDWGQFIDKSFEDNVAIGFGEHDISNGRNRRLHMLEPESLGIDNILTDFMIIHPADKMVNAFTLFDEEKLLPANAGWHQVLVDQHGDETINYEGGIQLSRLVFGTAGLQVNDYL